MTSTRRAHTLTGKEVKEEQKAEAAGESEAMAVDPQAGQPQSVAT